MRATINALIVNAVLAMVLIGWLGACSSEPTEPEYQVYSNANIWTGKEGAELATTMVVADGRIHSIGGPDVLQEYSGSSTQVIDLGGAFVVPGFIDTHTHFLSGSFGLSSVNLRDAHTPQEFSRRIADFAATQQPGRWILEGDWDHEAWGGQLPERTWIDAVTRNNPVFVARLDGHMALANSAALAAAKITADLSLIHI